MRPEWACPPPALAVVGLTPRIGMWPQPWTVSQCNWLADQRRGENSVPSVKPAVGAPLEPIDDIVPHGRRVEAVEHDNRLAVRDVVAIGIGNEQQVGGAQRPDPAEADFDAGQFLPFVP